MQTASKQVPLKRVIFHLEKSVQCSKTECFQVIKHEGESPSKGRKLRVVALKNRKMGESVVSKQSIYFLTICLRLFGIRKSALQEIEQKMQEITSCKTFKAQI